MSELLHSPGICAGMVVLTMHKSKETDCVGVMVSLRFAACASTICSLVPPSGITLITFIPNELHDDAVMHHHNMNCSAHCNVSECHGYMLLSPCMQARWQQRVAMTF